MRNIQQNRRTERQRKLLLNYITRNYLGQLSSFSLRNIWNVLRNVGDIIYEVTIKAEKWQLVRKISYGTNDR